MTPVFDTLIRGGRLADARSVHAIDLGLRDGRVAAWLAPGTDATATEVIDAAGHILIPGVVDAHVHLREPGLVHKEGFATGTRAAAAGGVTTVLVMPTDLPPTLTPDSFEDKLRLAEGQCHVDFGLQAACTGPEHVAALAALGAVSFEMFLGDIPDSLAAGDDANLLAMLDAIGAAGAVAGVTPATDAIIAAALAVESGRTDPLAFSRTRPPQSEAMAVARACAAARLTGTAVHLRQISCAPAAALLAALRQGLPGLSAETMVHNLMLTEADTLRLGPFAKVIPPLRTDADVAAMWQHLHAGAIDIVATDHAPHLPEEKETGRSDIWAAPGGLPGVQTFLPLMIDAVAGGRLDWPALVRLCCETPARLFGLAPQKGALQPGADADVVIIDPAAQGRIATEDQLSKARVTPFDGRPLRGLPIRALLRGRTIMQHGRPEGAPTGQPLRPGRRA